MRRIATISDLKGVIGTYRRTLEPLKEGQALYHAEVRVVDKTGRIPLPARKCSVESEECSESIIKVYEARVIQLLDANEQEIEAESIPTEIQERISAINGRIQLCYFHLLDALAQENLMDHVTRG